MIEGQPSRTAIGAAMRRATHQLVDRPLVFEDPLALRLLPPQAVARVKGLVARPAALRRSAPLRAFIAARSRAAEDALAMEYQRGLRQYVLLGAGLDTFACGRLGRFPDLRVFEVDIAATQEWKRALLGRAGLTTPDAVRFVTVDFARENFLARLHAAGLDPAAPAWFAWLGVSIYLTADQVRETLRILAGAASGSGVIFDYRVDRRRLSWRDRLAGWLMARRVAKLGEPWISELDPDQLRAMLAGLGYAAIEDIDATTLCQRYFTGRTDGLAPGRGGHLAIARVP